ncbi:MAG TPA: efflux transporter periplasmic adaptor subunit, partial [Planctomycetota bacterium]|nr:efflux transporter periplasmic adaptor subunit [Planctomycetota bacterium]
PVTALRKAPSGDHVFVLAAGKDGKLRAQQRRVEVGALLGDEVLLTSGVQAGEQVAATGSFKLREGALVAVAPPESK